MTSSSAPVVVPAGLPRGAAVRDRARSAGPAAWTVALLVPVLIALAVYVDSLTTDAQREVALTGRGMVTGLIGVVPALAGAAVLAGRRTHPLGVVLAAFGLVWVVDGVAESWVAYSLAHGLPGTDAAYWFVARFGAFLLLGLPMVLVLYPDGRLMPGRWRLVSLAVLAAAASLPLALQAVGDDVMFAPGERPAGVRTDWLALGIPEESSAALLTVLRSVTLVALGAAVLVPFARHRRATGLERTRLRWLLWAAIVCVLTMLVLLVVPAGAVAVAALGLAVAVTAVSVAIGVLRPGLADIDALVAGTLTYAGVAAVVVAVDLAALAAASALVGPRLDERQVTVLVLVLAVAVYGPLRGWLGAAVGRLLLGRRGDRYGVVSSFAARMERAATLDEQLPALVEAVVQTFKVPAARVEVLLPGGGTVSAGHGRDDVELQSIDIAYRGEQVGRLRLPRRGYRSLLSARDQALLVDVVRQAAIAVRAGMLADALQDSRERLVLGREEDRRRIRRDLHDGLGPALGGVALRLQAADNAVDGDPERARELVRTARAEVQEALDDVRRLVHDLRPPALDDLGLAEALGQQADRVRSEVAVDLRVDGADGLPAAVEVAAYRIVSEALTNVVRHARARRVVVRVAPAGAVLEIEVADDGRGIGDDVAAGVGLASMRERAEELGGGCEVICPSGGGTRVRAWLPYGGGPAHPGAEERAHPEAEERATRASRSPAAPHPEAEERAQRASRSPAAPHPEAEERAQRASRSPEQPEAEERAKRASRSPDQPEAHR